MANRQSKRRHYHNDDLPAVDTNHSEGHGLGLRKKSPRAPPSSSESSDAQTPKSSKRGNRVGNTKGEPAPASNGAPSRKRKRKDGQVGLVYICIYIWYCLIGYTSGWLRRLMLGFAANLMFFVTLVLGGKGTRTKRFQAPSSFIATPTYGSDWAAAEDPDAKTEWTRKAFRIWRYCAARKCGKF